MSQNEVHRLLVVAMRAAHKMSVNRSVYRYPWMNHISAEMIELEEEADALETLCDELGIDWRAARVPHIKENRG